MARPLGPTARGGNTVAHSENFANETFTDGMEAGIFRWITHARDSLPTHTITRSHDHTITRSHEQEDTAEQADAGGQSRCRVCHIG